MISDINTQMNMHILLLDSLGWDVRFYKRRKPWSAGCSTQSYSMWSTGIVRPHVHRSVDAAAIEPT